MSIHDEAHHAVNAELEAENRYASGRAVDRPPYYLAKIDGEEVQVLDIAEAYDLPMHLFRSLAFLIRAGKKNVSGELEDLESALFYTRRWVSHYHAWYISGSDMDYDLIRKYPPAKIARAFDLPGVRAVAVEALMMVHSDERRPISKKTIDGLIGSIQNAINEYHLEHSGSTR